MRKNTKIGIGVGAAAVTALFAPVIKNVDGNTTTYSSLGYNIHNKLGISISKRPVSGGTAWEIRTPIKSWEKVPKEPVMAINLPTITDQGATEVNPTSITSFANPITSRDITQYGASLANPITNKDITNYHRGEEAIMHRGEERIMSSLHTEEERKATQRPNPRSNKGMAIFSY